MTMATINLLIGIEGIFIALGVAAMALAYAAEGLRVRGGLRRWDLLVAVVLGSIVWGSTESIGQSFARASDARLVSEAANAGSLAGVAIVTLVAIAILAADAIYWRKRARSFALWLSDAPM